MQLFLIGPFLVFFYFRMKNKKIMWYIINLLIIASMITCYILAYEHNLHLSALDPINFDGKINLWFQILYVKPYIRIVVYLQGILAGFIYSYYHKVSEKQEIIYKDPISKAIVSRMSNGNNFSRCFFIAGVLLMYYFIAFQEPVYHDLTNSDVWSRSSNAIALAIHRFGFVLGFSLFCLTMLMNKAQWINCILGSSLFEPFAKISYCAFLVHAGIMTGIYASQDNTLFGGIYALKEWLGFSCLALFGGLILHLIVEIPFQNLEKLCFRRDH